MYLKCLCGNLLSNTASPGINVYFLLNEFAKENLENLVDKEVSESGVIDMWPEHWEDAGTIEVWKCDECERIYLNADQDPEDIIVYKVERKGLKIPKE